MVPSRKFWGLILLLAEIVSMAVSDDSSSESLMSDYKNHPCSRECSDSGPPMICEYTFTIEYYYTLTQACYNCPYNATDCFRPHCVSADGVSRGILTVNRMLPGPGIRVCEKDTIVVNVKNKMEGGEGTAIHWHGILQRDTPHMDGVAMITQCPIHQHTTFQYRFKADTPGTHFWHAHAGLQRADGVFGSLVIRQSRSRDKHSMMYDYDLPEHTILLNDWLDEMGATRFAGHHHAMTEHVPKSLLINGRGMFKEFSSSTSSHGGHSSHSGHMSSDNTNNMHHENGHSMQMHGDMAPHFMPTSHPELQMTHGEEHSHNMESLTTQSDMEHMVHMNNHRMLKRSASDASDVTVPTMSDGGDNSHHDMDKQSDSVYTPHSVFNVKRGKRYRFRVASNGVNNCPITFSIDNHTITVISSDGSPFKPVKVESFNIFAGERYDFVLEASQSIGNYWIRTNGLADCGQEYKKASQTAILRYEGSLPRQPRESTDYQNGDKEGLRLNPFNVKAGPMLMSVDQLESLLPDDVTVTTAPDKRYYLAMDFNMIQNYRYNDPRYYPLHSMMAGGGHAHHMFSPQVNHISFMMPPSPPLSQYSEKLEEYFCDEESVEKNCAKEFCECTHRLKVKVGDVVELILVDEGQHMDNNHPMHLHGYNFRVVAMEKLGNATTVEHVKMLDRLGLIKRKLNKPIAKDTVTVPDGGYTIIRFHATSPGFWLFHCHIAFHMEMGMNMVIQVGEPSEMAKAPPAFPRCGDWTLETQIQEAKKQQQQKPLCEPPPTSSSIAVTAATPTTTAPTTTQLPPLHQVYLGGIQQTTDVNFADVTLHYALLLWMTGRKKSASQPTAATPIDPSTQHDLIREGLSFNGRKMPRKKKAKRNPPRTNSSVSAGKGNQILRKFKIPLLSIHTRNNTFRKSSSSIIELSSLPKMMVPAHNIDRIISKKSVVNSRSARGSHNLTDSAASATSHAVVQMKPLSDTANTPNISLSFVQNGMNHILDENAKTHQTKTAKQYLKPGKSKVSKSRRITSKQSKFSVGQKTKNFRKKNKASHLTHKRTAIKQRMNRHLKNVRKLGHKKPV